MRFIRYATHACGLAGICGLLAVTALPAQAQSQNLPSSPRTVFKCESDGQTVYTDQPCLGTQKLETLRLHAVSAPAMREATDARDARGPYRESAGAGWRNPGAAAEGKPAVTYERVTRQLAHTPQAECPHLSQRIALVEAEEQNASSRTIQAIQERLSIQRKRYRELGCASVWSADILARG
jgi:hypothetical protein